MTEEEQAKQVLREARKLLMRRGAWIQGTMARTAGSENRLMSGRRTRPKSSQAACWCAAGAVYRVMGTNYTLEFRDRVFGLLANVVDPFVPLRNPEQVVIGWNDREGRRKTEVLQAFAKAAA